jgi:protein-S-isoprenylcysteine O-methyltransferase Ste14
VHRIGVFLYGVFAYACFRATFLYATGWATPTMTAAHLLFAVTTTAYILIAIRFEERDLDAVHGARYAEYRRSLPMLVRRPRVAQPVATKIARTEVA